MSIIIFVFAVLATVKTGFAGYEWGQSRKNRHPAYLHRYGSAMVESVIYQDFKSFLTWLAVAAALWVGLAVTLASPA